MPHDHSACSIINEHVLWSEDIFCDYKTCPENTADVIKRHILPSQDTGYVQWSQDGLWSRGMSYYYEPCQDSQDLAHHYRAHPAGHMSQDCNTSPTITVGINRSTPARLLHIQPVSKGLVGNVYLGWSRGLEYCLGPDQLTKCVKIYPSPLCLLNTQRITQTHI